LDFYYLWNNPCKSTVYILKWATLPPSSDSKVMMNCNFWSFAKSSSLSRYSHTILYASLSLDRSRPSFVPHSFWTTDKYSTIRILWASSQTACDRANFSWYNANGNGSVDDSSLILMPDKSVPWNTEDIKLKRWRVIGQSFSVETHHPLKLTHRVLERFRIIHVQQIHGLLHGFIEYPLVHFGTGPVGADHRVLFCSQRFDGPRLNAKHVDAARVRRMILDGSRDIRTSLSVSRVCEQCDHPGFRSACSRSR